jgi:glutamate N-acetyltransferase / amino-acid N-acetyltransferase
VSVTHPRGFAAAGVTAGCKPSGMLDLGLLVGDPGTTMTGLFTTNRVEAAPVTIGRSRIADGMPRVVVVNSGQANAATGERGFTDATAISDELGELLGIEGGDIVPCSTGVIGEPLHMDRLLPALPTAVDALGTDGGADFAHAIMTTDTVAKQASAGAGVRVGGCAKGVGMIAPNLATMLAFLTTDAAVGPSDLRKLAIDILEPRFTSLTVDASTSTNDTVLLMASGAATGEVLGPASPAWDPLVTALAEVADSLVRQLIADGEGAGHVLVIDVDGAANDREARAIARAVADSPLVKTAAFGGDPNPGRIVQAAGAAGVPFDPAELDVRIGGITVARSGMILATYFEPASALSEQARRLMKDIEIHVSLTVGAGPGRSRVFGCDLSDGYVRINGEYTT